MPAASATIDRGPSAPTTTRAAMVSAPAGSPIGSAVTVASWRWSGSSTAAAVVPRRTSTPHAAA